MQFRICSVIFFVTTKFVFEIMNINIGVDLCRIATNKFPKYESSTGVHLSTSGTPVQLAGEF